MARRRGKRTFSRGAAVVLIALGLVACGETVAPTDPAEEITPPVPLSPTAGEIPEDTFQATATITDEGLEPDRFTGQVGTAFQLLIEGDGTEHTLEIEELVATKYTGVTMSLPATECVCAVSIAEGYHRLLKPSTSSSIGITSTMRSS